jgi:hypothetical protein
VEVTELPIPVTPTGANGELTERDAEIALKLRSPGDKQVHAFTTEWEGSGTIPQLVPTDLPPMQLAVAMAAHCKQWQALYPGDIDTLEDFTALFDAHATALLDQCNSAQEAEQLLLAHFTQSQLAGGSTMSVLDFALRHGVRGFAANRWAQGYAMELWTQADVHFEPRDEQSKDAVRQASIIIGLLQSTHPATQLLAVPLLCLGTLFMVVPIVFFLLMGLGGPWAVVPACAGLGALAVAQLGWWSVWAWLALMSMLLLAAYSTVARNEVGDGAHYVSRGLYLTVSLAWNTPFIKFSLFALLYLSFVLAVTALATADRQVVGWPELAVYSFGAGLLVAEVTQLVNGKTAGWWAELRNHLSNLWNLLDVSIVVLIAVCAWQRLPLIIAIGDAAENGSGSYDIVEAESFGQDSGSAAAPEGKGISAGWHVEESTAGQLGICILCIVAWVRLLGLMLLSADLGPLIQMVVEMVTHDLRKFLLLCAIIVLGFGASISVLLFGDKRSSISSLAGALHVTAQGLLGVQDMEQVATAWEVEAVYTLYLVAAQVLLVNLLIAMFASTYERIKEHETDEWRLARAQIMLEYSHEVRGVLELPVLNLLGLALVPLGWLWTGVRRCLCFGHVTEKSWLRLPWEEVEVVPRFSVVDAEAAATHKAAITEMAKERGMWVADATGRAGMVVHVWKDGDVGIEWVNTGEYEEKVSPERLALVVARLDDKAVLAAAGWEPEWGLRSPVRTMHPALEDKASGRGDSDDEGSAEEKKQAEQKSQIQIQAKITRRRSLHDETPEPNFGEATLHARWLEERADADPTDFGELDDTADSRAEVMERKLTEQMQQMERTLAGQVKTEVVSVEAKVASLEKKLQEQQETMQRQAEESNTRLDRLITLVSVIHHQQTDQEGRTEEAGSHDD